MPIRITRTPPRRTELMRAVNMRNYVEVARLLAAGANVNARGNNGYTELMRTVRGENTRPRYRRDIIRALIRAGANVNARGPNGRTARNYAINENRGNRGNRQEAINVALEHSSNHRWWTDFQRRFFGSNSNSNRPVLSDEAKANLRAKANTPVTRNWTVMNNKEDPISLLNKTNWPVNNNGIHRAIEVNQNGRKTYFTLGSFNGWFGNRWKTMGPNSNNSIHNTKTHPLTRQPIMRKNVRLVKFIGNKNKASEP